MKIVKHDCLQQNATVICSKVSKFVILSIKI